MNFSKILKIAKKDKKITLYYGGECYAAVTGAIYRLSDMPVISGAAEFFNVCGVDDPNGWEVKIEKDIPDSALFGIFTGETIAISIPVERDCTVSLGGAVAALFGCPDTEQLELFPEDEDAIREDFRIPVTPALLSPLSGIVKYKYLYRKSLCGAVGAYERDELAALIRPADEMLEACGKLCDVGRRIMKFAEDAELTEDDVWSL